METISITDSTLGSPESTQWQKILEKVVKAVVAIKFCTARAFDTERSGFGQATGFIVDKENGLILTNRHVVRPGPVVAEAQFLDHEEVPIYPVYRDPIHDFGFYRFDPKAVKYMELAEIELAPEEAKVGIEIRVVGNDAGEKLSILSGTFARLDRPAPVYGEDDYNDFNTFYYQAASNTSGGSSGSPVINVSGKAVALNAGGKRSAASSFYLPLYRVARALKYLQKGELHVPRGDIQTIFQYTPYDQVHKLGLREETETAVRATFPEGIGMLVIDQVVPMGPAHSILEPGDVVVKINGNMVTDFVSLEEILDSNVGQDITVDVERGGAPMTFTIKVTDLHSITPSSFLEVGGGIVHPLSYQQAKNYRLPVGSVWVASEGYMLGRAGLRRGCIIKAVGKTDTPDLETFEKCIAQFPNKTRVPVYYFSAYDRYQEKVASIRMDRDWHPLQLWTRDDSKGIWECRESTPAPKPDFTPKPGSAGPLTLPSEVASKMCKSFVLVTFQVPFAIDGSTSDNFLGLGIIADAEKGLVIVDMNTVPIPIGDLYISFGGSFEIPGSVVYLHPIHNFGVIKYDPSLLLNSTFESATFCNDTMEVGQSVLLVGITQANQPFFHTTTVSKIEELFINESNPPRFRAYNEQVVHLDKAASCLGAVIVNQDGKIQAIWSSYSSSEAKNPSNSLEFYRGMPAYLFEDIVGPLIKGESPKFYSLEAEFWPISLSDARNLGLPDEWIQKVEATTARKLLSIRRLVVKSDAFDKLKTGDALLAINGKIVTKFREVELAINSEGGKSVEVTLLRKQQVITIPVTPVLLSGKGTNRVVSWAGAMFQNTHRAVAQLGIHTEGVYCSRWHYGSPAHKYGLRATWWVVEINGVATPNLDKFLEVVTKIPRDAFVRIKAKGLQDKVSVSTLKMDYVYYPTRVLERDENNLWVITKVSDAGSDVNNNNTSN